MLKKHIAINQNGHPSITALDKRREALSTVFIPDSMRPSNGKETTAIASVQEYPSVQKIQQETNKKLIEIENILKTIFAFQNIPFIEFCLKNQEIFKRRFTSLPTYMDAIQKSANDSDSESTENQEVSKEDVIKLLRLYLRLYTRKQELDHINGKTHMKVIGHPRTSEPERSQIENSYSQVEAYKNTETQTLVLSKSSFLVQKTDDKKLFDPNEDAFMKAVINKLQKIQEKTEFNPIGYSSELTPKDSKTTEFVSAMGTMDHAGLQASETPFASVGLF